MNGEGVDPEEMRVFWVAELWGRGSKISVLEGTKVGWV